MASTGHDPFDPEVMKELAKDITHEEVSQLTRAMKKPEFREHFEEYINEISDPKNKKEYEQYLKQLEDAGEMPKGKVLLRCEPGVCVKTSIRFQSGQIQKLFLNICHTDKLGDVQFKRQGPKAHEDPMSAKSASGYAVSLPYSASPPRPDRDKNGHLCMVSDVAVSQRTFVQAVQNEAILKLVVDTVCEAITASCLKGGETVSRDFKVLRKMRCKGGTPMPMSVSEEMLLTTRVVGEGKQKKARVTPAELRKMQKQAKRERDEDKAKESTEAEPPVTAERDQDVGESIPDGTDVPSGLILQPKYKIVEIGELRDLSSFVDSSAGHSSAPSVHWNVPEKIRLDVELPGVKHGSEIDIDTVGVAGGIIIQTSNSNSKSSPKLRWEAV
ncbi:PIH1 domain containing [Perkinsus chesapeaki]|uniref:PIH1 domain containing n=1 Tax=Perkinsus chesapeaki TaxID=330153 RepID=A0A7J6LK04_PERCH|nr:PIH1 domain containing [Perkinsus chesapeaki]